MERATVESRAALAGFSTGSVISAVAEVPGIAKSPETPLTRHRGWVCRNPEFGDNT